MVVFPIPNIPDSYPILQAVLLFLTFSHYPSISSVPFIPLFLQGYIHLKMCPSAGAVGE
jgi:hypothetical protein